MKQRQQCLQKIIMKPQKVLLDTIVLISADGLRGSLKIELSLNNILK